jgi:hypothetical protein
MTIRTAILVFTLPCVLLLASVGAFLLYVPMLTLLSTVTVLMALVLTFAMGVVAGGRRIRISRMIRRLQ